MTNEHVVLAGHLGPLAEAVAETLSRRRMWISRLQFPQTGLPSAPVQSMVFFPFPPSMRRAVIRRRDEHLAWLRAVTSSAVSAGVTRLVLRSHAIAYGSSMKNPGLLDEGRPTLLPRNSVDRRWLEAEAIVLAHDTDGIGTAAVRLVSILDPGEGDLVTSMLTRACVAPLAGYDPQIQLLSLNSAARCLVAVLHSPVRGVVNGAPHGTIPVKAAVKASAALRLPVSGVIQKPVRNLLWKLGLARFPGEAMDLIKYNWTVSGERARVEADFESDSTSPDALRTMLANSGKGRPSRIKEDYDEFGLDAEYLKRLNWWFHFLTRIYWRAESEGIENVPDSGAALLVSNHRGFMPFDGVVHRTLILAHRRRHIRFLVIPSLFKFPFLSDFLIRQGGVVASQVNTRKLFDRSELVGIFPEGINGAFRMYRGAYRLGEMGRNVFAKMAIENQVPIVPAATIGHVEIFPILGKVHSTLVTKLTGWPFLPLTPTFPLVPVPLPTKWHIRYLDPILVDQYATEDARNPQAVAELAEKVRETLQAGIDELLARRRHVFFGRIFAGPAAGNKPVGAAG